MTSKPEVEVGDTITITDRDSPWCGYDATVITTPPESSHVGVRVRGFEDIMSAVGIYVRRENISKKKEARSG